MTSLLARKNDAPALLQRDLRSYLMARCLCETAERAVLNAHRRLGSGKDAGLSGSEVQAMRLFDRYQSRAARYEADLLEAGVTPHQLDQLFEDYCAERRGEDQDEVPVDTLTNEGEQCSEEAVIPVIPAEFSGRVATPLLDNISEDFQRFIEETDWESEENADRALTPEERDFVVKELCNLETMREAPASARDQKGERRVKVDPKTGKQKKQRGRPKNAA